MARISYTVTSSTTRVETGVIRVPADTAEDLPGYSMDVEVIRTNRGVVYDVVDVARSSDLSEVVNAVCLYCRGMDRKHRTVRRWLSEAEPAVVARDYAA